MRADILSKVMIRLKTIAYLTNNPKVIAEGKKIISDINKELDIRLEEAKKTIT